MAKERKSKSAARSGNDPGAGPSGTQQQLPIKTAQQSDSDHSDEDVAAAHRKEVIKYNTPMKYKDWSAWGNPNLYRPELSPIVESPGKPKSTRQQQPDSAAVRELEQSMSNMQVVDHSTPRSSPTARSSGGESSDGVFNDSLDWQYDPTADRRRRGPQSTSTIISSSSSDGSPGHSLNPSSSLSPGPSPSPIFGGGSGLGSPFSPKAPPRGGKQRRVQRGRHTHHIICGVERMQFNRYIYEVFRSTHSSVTARRLPQSKQFRSGGGKRRATGRTAEVTRISRNSMQVLNTMVKELIRRFAAECDSLLYNSRHVQLRESEALAAVRFMLNHRMYIYEEVLHRYQMLLKQFPQQKSPSRSRPAAKVQPSRYGPGSSPQPGPSSAP